MHWYGGSIAEAVTLSKQKNAIFVVFVEGENELSSEMSSVLDDQDVLKRLSDAAHFLAVKLKSGSTDYTHFAQIYQFVPVPSLFFIGRNGTPLEVVCAGVQPGNLATRIDRILDQHNKDRPPMLPSTSGQNIKQQTANLIQSEAAPAPAPAPAPASAPASAPAPASPAPRFPAPETQETVAKEAEEPEPSGPAAKIPKLQESEFVCVGDVCVRRAPPDGAGPSREDTPETNKMESTESTISTEEKLERAKELIEAKRREKAEKEKQLEKEKEKERRNLGQGVAELKRWQADQELKQIQEERKREKMENNLARQRILEQIALDRAERRARDAPPPPAPAVSPPTSGNTSGDGGARARIQFKLPDGASHTAHFDADGCLRDVTRYVADNLQLSSSQFSLWTAFPRRELTDPDATLRRLELAPSAALIVLPRRTAAAVARPGTFGNILAFLTQLFTSMVLQPSQQLYGWVLARLSPPDAPRGGPAPPAPAAAPAAPRAPAGHRRRGNVHRITGDSPDDENNTWNGNSTQQM